MVLLADDLPLLAHSKDVIQRRHFDFLNELDWGIRLGCIYSNEEPPYLDEYSNLFGLPVPPRTPTEEERNRLISILELAGRLKRSRRPPEIRLAADPILREQIRALNDDRDLETGQEHLSYLIRNFNLPFGEKVAVAKLVQGKSGARVFRFRPKMSVPESGDLIIKLNPRNDLWKLELEVERHRDATKSLGVRRYQIHVADLKEIDPSGRRSGTNNNHITEYGNWCAVCYDFLGGKEFGPFLDLETALIAAPEKLQESRPFLIDFPCYQKSGHPLQDLASLEIALKFALMDRQGDSPKESLRAFDHTHSQMDIWQEMEDYLLSDTRNLSQTGWQQRHCFMDNVALCFELVALLRKSAEKVQAQKCGEEKLPQFLDEYLPALLYHRVRAIGYTSLSIFKRLLAIYSTSAILDRLEFELAT